MLTSQPRRLPGQPPAPAGVVLFRAQPILLHTQWPRRLRADDNHKCNNIVLFVKTAISSYI